MTDLALCAVCAADEPQPVICRHCEDRIRRDLDNIGRLRADLAGFLLPGRGRAGRASGKPGSRPPARLEVIAATDCRSSRIQPDEHGRRVDDVVNIDACLLGWARLCCEERQLAAVLGDVFDCLRVISISRDWLVRHPAVGEFASEMRDCAIGLRRLVGDVAEPIVGRCPAVDPEGLKNACEGPLRLEWAGPLPDDLDAANAPSRVSCGRCGGGWSTEPAEMVQLLRVVRPQARFPVSRDWAVREYGHLGLSHALLRKWVHRDLVHGYADGQVDLVGVLARVGQG